MADPNFDAKQVFDFAVDLAKQAGARILSGRAKLRDDISQDQSNILKKVRIRGPGVPVTTRN